MILLVTGGSGSGKSEYGEMRVTASGLPQRYYVATMKVWGREDEQKVERHRKLRQGKGFRTIEAPEALHQVRIWDSAENTVILLECMTNLAANELFSGEQDWENLTSAQWKERRVSVRERILEGICCLKSQCALLVVITGQVDQDGGEYDQGTQTYIRLLGELNCLIAAMAEEAVEVVAGIPIILKGEKGGEQG